ncbi:MAG: hypothetical protein [Podoviridae sp. ctDWo9]|nr:MAG: hypothetical protein [Podoviridae sp. ctDWo9]
MKPPPTRSNNNKGKAMSLYYAVLDNGSGSSKRPPKAQRQFVEKYLESKGMTASGPGMRSKREKRLREEARAAYRAPKAPKSSSRESKIKKVSPLSPSKIKKVSPLSPAEQRSGGLGNSKRERARGMSAAEARWLDYGPQKRAIVVAKNPRPANKNYRKGKNH